MNSVVHLGDCLDILRELPDNSVDAVVTDPPYGLEFMGKEWDAYDSHGYQRWCELWGEQCLRVVKPGGHALVFGGTRTYHRLASGLEDAGFEIRDTIAWMYGSGFPKSLDVSKAIDKRPGVRAHAEFAAHLAERRTAAGLSRADVSEKVVGTRTGACWNWEHHQFPEAKWWPALRDLLHLDPSWGETVAEAERAKVGESSRPAGWFTSGNGHDITAASTDDARTWQGWGTALKPAYEPITLARKPLQGTVAANVLAHGTGALNIDGCRIATDDNRARFNHARTDGTSYVVQREDGYIDPGGDGRWPANVTLDPEAADALDQQTGELTSGVLDNRNSRQRQSGFAMTGGTWDGDAGGASRFYYIAKTSRAERNAGLDGFEERDATDRHAYVGLPDQRMEREQERRSSRNHHPTVKPIALMRWLTRLITPPKGTVLDPFTGSGTTGIAAALEGFQFIGIEREPDYHNIATARIAWWQEHGEAALEEVRKAEQADQQRQEHAAMGQLDLFN